MKAKNYSGKFLGDLESEVMNIVWQSPAPISVREVTENLQAKRSIAYTTIMTIMGRLVEKGLLSRRLLGSSYLYQPKVSHERFIEKSVHHIFTTTISALGIEAITHFLKEIKQLSPKKRQELLKILDKK